MLLIQIFASIGFFLLIASTVSKNIVVKRFDHPVSPSTFNILRNSTLRRNVNCECFPRWASPRGGPFLPFCAYTIDVTFPISNFRRPNEKCTLIDLTSDDTVTSTAASKITLKATSTIYYHPTLYRRRWL